MVSTINAAVPLGLGDGWDELRLDDRADSEEDDQRRADDERDDQRPHGSAVTERRQRTERQDRAPDGKGRGTGERDDAVLLDDEPRSRDPMQAQQRRHDREGEPGDDRAGVADECAGEGQRDRGGCRNRSRKADAGEMEPAGEVDLVAPDEQEDDRRSDRGNEREALKYP